MDKEETEEALVKDEPLEVVVKNTPEKETPYDIQYDANYEEMLLTAEEIDADD